MRARIGEIYRTATVAIGEKTCLGEDSMSHKVERFNNSRVKVPTVFLMINFADRWICTPYKNKHYSRLVLTIVCFSSTRKKRYNTPRCIALHDGVGSQQSGERIHIHKISPAVY